uniref:Orn/DAP/Arg decarboxylase 2 C-terminal domain-containing protein n=1 Tax=Astatotilapia calliptera TaxID=8154 RepID=A0A3P8NV90_ASTCA
MYTKQKPSQLNPTWQSLKFKQIISLQNSAGFQMRLLDIAGVKFEEVLLIKTLYNTEGTCLGHSNITLIIAEPGRFYFDSAFTLAVNVISKRVEDTDERSGKYTDISEKMMMYYISDGVYGSLSCLINDPFHAKVEPWPLRLSVIWGPTCAGSDKVTESCWIPELHVGDWLLIDNMGAYSLSTSTDFNGFERAHIYPVVTAKTWLAIHQSCLKNTIN